MTAQTIDVPIERGTTSADLRSASWTAARSHDLVIDLQFGRLQTMYQPVLDIHTGEIVGTEALLRWRHRNDGPITPDVFVALAEDTGVIDTLGWYVLTAALAQQGAWMAELGEAAPKFVAVNVSPLSLMAPGFVDNVAAALASSGVPAKALTLEITESAPLNDITHARRVLIDLAALGVTIDLDDFGTGYAHLAALAHLPIHVVKLDRSLIQDVTRSPQSAVIATSIITMLQALGMRSVAEGVETGEQLDWLRANGGDLAQGFWISRPIPGEEITALLTSTTRW